MKQILIKTPAVAGLFYPDDAAVLQAELDDLLARAEADIEVESGGPPKALIAPHAGYIYSGATAAHAYAALKPWADRFDRVVVLAPAHRVALNGIASSSAEAFETPLGLIPVDRVAVRALNELPQVAEQDIAFAEEHALEVQLPFLQKVLGDFLLVPLIVGAASTDDVSAIIEQLASDHTLIVVSSDLSHFHDYRECQQRDRCTSAKIEQLDGQHIGPQDACGAYPMRGLLLSAQRHGWQVRTLDLRNSGDTAGDKSRVVGYGAYEFH